MLVDDAVAAPSRVGTASMPNYGTDLFDAAVQDFGPAPSHTWAGQSDDAFFLDLRVFNLLYGGDLSEVGDDTLKAILTTYAARYSGGNATTDDFLAVVDEIAGVGRSALLDPWLYTSALPPLP